MINPLIGAVVTICVAIVSTLVWSLLFSDGYTKFIIQTTALATSSYLLLNAGIIAFPAAALYTLIPVIARVFRIAFGKYMRQRALSGAFGEQAQWASEIVDDGDEAFVNAVNHLPRVEMREVGIIAESKGELRDLTVERHREHFE